MSQQMIPYNRSYTAPEVQVAIAGAQGVFITLDLDRLDAVVETFECWFSEREDVIFVDQGETDKQGLGFLRMQWTGYEIDRLFLDILETSDFIEDYTAYGRSVYPWLVEVFQAPPATLRRTVAMFPFYASCLECC